MVVGWSGVIDEKVQRNKEKIFAIIWDGKWAIVFWGFKSR